MMDLDSAIQHCKEQVQEQAKKGCYSCAEEHHQLAEWLKELKAYRETWHKLEMWLADTRLAIAPDETLNDMDEKLVRVAQVDMIDTVLEWMDKQELSRSEKPNTCGDAISRKYILDLIDTKGANLDDDLLIVEQWIQDAPSVNPHPIECGDAISRQAVFEQIAGWIISGEYGFTNATDYLSKKIKALPSVTPQQKVGKWIPVSERLPEEETYVLTTIKVPNRIAHARSGWYQDGFFHNDNGDTWRATDMEVIAWMPLPEPYKGESEDKE